MLTKSEKPYNIMKPYKIGTTYSLGFLYFLYIATYIATASKPPHIFYNIR